MENLGTVGAHEGTGIIWLSTWPSELGSGAQGSNNYDAEEYAIDAAACNLHRSVRGLVDVDHKLADLFNIDPG
jgi:hypothetical protein